MNILSRILIMVLLLNVGLCAEIKPCNIIPSKELEKKLHIRILDQKELDIDSIQGVKFAEISDLAYDKPTKILYMVSDKGALYAFRTSIEKDHLTIVPLRAAYLKNRKGKRLKKWKRDSEGMTLDGKRRLFISFEGDVKIAWFHRNGSKFGQLIRRYSLPVELKNIKHYRYQNRALEALAWHPKYGLLTAAELPLKRYNIKHQVIYSLKGKRWYFEAEPEAKSAVTAIEVMDDGNLLVLERSFTGLFNPFVVTLKKVYINNCKGKCKTEVLAKFNTHKGWSIDNFEGLTKVGKRHYLIVSDNGDNFYERTLLIYFEVL